MNAMASQITGVLIVLLKHLFRHRLKKISKLCVIGLCESFHRCPVNSPHKGTVTRKVFPFDGIMVYRKTTSCIFQRINDFLTWWRHQMKTLSALLAICAGNSPVPGEFPTQRPVTRSFDVYFDLHPNKRLSKHSWGWWFETLSCSLWRHRNDPWQNSPANYRKRHDIMDRHRKVRGNHSSAWTYFKPIGYIKLPPINSLI